MFGTLNKLSLAIAISTAIGLVTLPGQAALLVSSGGDNSIKQYDETTGAYIRDFVTSGSGGLLNPQGLSLGANGNLFVSSQGNNSIKEYSGTTGEFVRDFVSSDDGLSFPIGLTFAEDGSLFVSSRSVPGANTDGVERNGILQYNGTTGELLNGFVTGALGFGAPIDVAVGGLNDDIFYSYSFRGFNAGGIRRQDTTNSFTELPAESFPLSTLPFNPEGLVLSGNDLFFTNSQEVGLIDLTNNTVNSFFVDKGSGDLREAIGLTIGENDNLFVVNSATNSVKQYDRQTGDFLGDFVTSGSGGLSRPTYITSANVPVPEPSSLLGVVVLSGLFVGGAWQRRASKKRF